MPAFSLSGPRMELNILFFHFWSKHNSTGDIIATYIFFITCKCIHHAFLRSDKEKRIEWHIIVSIIKWISLANYYLLLFHISNIILVGTLCPSIYISLLNHDKVHNWTGSEPHHKSLSSQFLCVHFLCL